MGDYDDIAFGLPSVQEIKDHLLRTKSARSKRQTIGAFPSSDLDIQEDDVEKCDNLSAIIEDMSKLSIPSQYFTPNETFQKPIQNELFYTPNDTQISTKNQEFIEKVSQILNNTETRSPTPPNNNEFCEVLETSSEDINLSNIIEKLDAHIEESSLDMKLKDNLYSDIICLSDDDVEFTINRIKEEPDLSRYACLQAKYEDISGITENINEAYTGESNFEEADSVVVLLNTSDEGSDQSELEQNCDYSSQDNLLIVDISRDSLEAEYCMQQHNINKLEAIQVQGISNEDKENIDNSKNQQKFLMQTEYDADSSVTSQDENQKKNVSENVGVVQGISNEDEENKDSSKNQYEFADSSVTTQDEDQYKNFGIVDDFITSGTINNILPISQDQRQNVSINTDFNTSEVSDYENEKFEILHKSSTNEQFKEKNDSFNDDFSSLEMADYRREPSSCSGYYSSKSKLDEKNLKDISQSYSVNNVSFNDTISEMEKALAMGLDYSSSEEEQSSNEQTVKQDIKKTPKSQIPLLTATKSKPGKFDYIISPVSNYIKKPSPTHFKLPQPIVSKKKTPTPHKYTSTVFKDVKSPVMLYIKNSPAAPLQQKVATNRTNISQTLFPSVNNKPGHLSLPTVAYKPAKTVVNYQDKEKKLPESIENLIPYRPKIIKHEKRLNQGQNVVERKLLDSNLTLNDYSISGQDISIHVTTEPLRK